MIEQIRASSVQTRLWALQQLVPADPVYNVSLGLRLLAPLATDKVEVALSNLLSRHEVFRTCFPANNGVVEPQVHWDRPLQIRCWEESVPQSCRTARAEEIIRTVSGAAFDLASAPAVRAGIVRFAPDEQFVYIIVHHLVIDQSSIQILIEDFEHLLEHGPHAMAESSEPYSSFTRWEAAYLDSTTYRKDLEKWRSALAGAPVLVDLQTDRPRGKEPTFNGDMVRVFTPPELYVALQARAREWRATTGIYLLALWVFQLYRRHQCRDIVMGSGIANRPADKFARTIGCFTNTLPLRFQIEPAWSFRQLFDHVRRSCLGAFERRFVPYTELVKLAPQPSLIGPTYANVYYDFHSESMSARDRISCVPSCPVHVFNHGAKTDLTFNVTATPERLNAFVEYNTDLFERASIEQMAAELGELLRDSLSDAGESISRLDARSERWSSEAQSEPVSPLRSLHALFSEAARKYPKRVALSDGPRQIDYRELDAQSSQVAFHLLARGIGRESIVGLSIPRSIESVVALLGIWKAGAAYLPLDPSYGEAHLRQMLKDAEPELIIGTAITLDKLRWEGTAAILVELLEPSAGPSRDLPIVTEDDLAYVIYTSGSTGAPKGVLVPHRVPWSRLLSEFLPISERDVFCHRTSLNFVDSIWEIFAALIRGARLSILSEDLVSAPERLVSTLAADGVTCMVVVPAFLDMLLESIENLDEQLPALKAFICGGDEISTALVRKFHQRLPGRRLINSYGTSETWDIAWHELEPERLSRTAVGRHVPGVKVYVLDRDLKSVPIGTAGDLYVGGDLLSRGYLHRPDLTAQTFICNSFAYGERMYRTGDRAKFGLDGLIYLLGRSNRQVKINGYRIELAEVEGALIAHPDVRAAAVICLKGALEKSLVAFMVLRQRADNLDRVIEQHLAGLLPPYAVPGRLVVLDTLPLTPTGKVDRQALLRQAEQHVVLDNSQPENPKELRILTFVRRLLRQPFASPTSSFFELGGSSISAIVLIAGLRKEGIELSLPDVLLRRTVREMAKVARARAALDPIAVQRSPFSDLPSDSRRCLPSNAVDALPATAMQQALLSETAARPKELLNVFQVSVEVRGTLHLASLQAALAQLVEAHPALRSGLLFDDHGHLMQVVFDPADIMRHLRIRRTVSVNHFVEELCASVAGGHCTPLMRFAIELRTTGLHELTLLAHHAVFDAWSVGIFFRDLLLAYDAKLSRDAGEQMTALATLAAENEKVSASNSARDFWKQALGSWQAAALPSQEAIAHNVQGPVLFEVRLSRRALARLTAIADQQQISLRYLLLAVHCESVGQWYGQHDVSTGVVIDTRGYASGEVSNLIGLFVNVVPLRVQRGKPIIELARETRKFEMNAAPFALYPSEAIKAAAGSSCGLNVAFNYVNFSEIISSSTVEKVSLLSRHSSVRSSMPLLVTFSVTREDSAVLTFESQNPNFSSEELACFGQLYRIHLAALLRGAGGNARIDPARWLRPVQVRRYDADRCLHEIIREQASRTPDAVAVSDGQHTLSYAQLEERSERLARLLRLRNVGPDDVVGVAIPRSAELVVSLLAILKAGGAYLPLDIEQGRARLQSILRQASPRLVLAEAENDAFADLLVLKPSDAMRSSALNTIHQSMWRVTPDHLAYVIFTSGSTGEPKGVMISHRAIVNRLQWMQTELAIDVGDVVMQKTPLSFDVSVWECFLPLLCGAKLICARPQLQYDPDYLVAALLENQVTTLHFVPQFLMELLEHPQAAAALQAVRRIVCSGDVLPPEVARKTRELAPKVALYNLYGPTEAAVDVMWHRVEPSDGEQQRVPIGHPIWNTAVHILDRNLQPVPPGAAGEIFIEGTGLARGYLGRPDLTAERFLPNPHGPPGSRMYRTGDGGRRLITGLIQFIGRVDNEVKLNGVRVNLAEVEAVMCAFPGVRAAVARTEQNRLCGYVVLQEQNTLKLTAFRAHVARNLPGMAIPTSYRLLHALPVTASGKLDRRADAAYAAARPLNDYPTPGARPSTETEADLAIVWKWALQRSELGVDEDFHAAGGDSIQAVRIIRALRARGYAFGVRDLLEHSTVRDLARFADRHVLKESSTAVLRDIAAPSALTAFTGALTGMQRHVLERYREDVVGAGVFHIQFAYRFRDRDLSLQAFERALARVTKRHAVFSSTFRMEPAGWSQQIGARRASHLTFGEWCRGQRADDLSAIRRLLEADRLARFEPGRAPLARFLLAPIDSARAWFVMSAHHAIYDGWSHRIFLGELLEAYNAEKQGRAEPEPASEAVFTELGAIQAVAERCPEARTAFVSATGRGALALTRAAPQREPPQFEDFEQELDGELLVLLLDRARAVKVSSKALFAHAFGGAVRTTLNQNSFGVLVNGRSADLSDPFGSVGLFWNILPMVCPPPDSSINSLRTTQAGLDSLDRFSNFPIGAVEGWSDAVHPVFRFLNLPPLNTSSNWGDLKLEQEVIVDRYDFPFVLTASLGGKAFGATISAQFDAARMRSSIARRLWQSFVVALESFCTDPVSANVSE